MTLNLTESLKELEITKRSETVCGILYQSAFVADVPWESFLLNLQRLLEDYNKFFFWVKFIISLLKNIEILMTLT